ncbi:MFS transporter [Halomonas sp. MCCC 1A17488]|uniref:MFS transporter n=1 Tax=unclassified Halomonas TaxID=2609666 RepID=UPI0018D22088|nr:MULTISPECIES: MFS transporter [unclassified Halomonas]MCE8017770.1 MFS transporter [Halomonas sp. MCCC 1A17488]MCG3241103.1 MFS transporter [Halomonas sp. MCCC 1A17488]QPP48960.1 MFS transporter [Halomonas sp. SS10-MC5]
MTLTLDHGRRVTLTYFIAFIAIGMCVGLLGPTLPHLAGMTGSGMGQIAILFTARALGTMLGSVLSGVLIDRFDGHRVLAAMLLLLAAGLAAVPFSQALVLLTAVMFLLGLAEVSVNAGANTLLLWTHGPASPPWISALHFCFGLGNMLIPLVLVVVLRLGFSFAWAFWLVALYVIVLLVPLLRQASPRPPDLTVGHRTAPPPRDGWRLAIFLLMFGLYVGMEVTFAGWITAYGVLGGMAPADAALLVTLFWLTLSAGRLVAIPLVRRLSPWMVLRGCLGLGLFSTLALHVQWLPLPLVALLFGLAASAIFPTLFGLSNQLMSANGRTTGWIFLACGIGGMAVPSLTGPLLERAGTAAFPLLLVVLVGLLILGLVLLRARVRLASR